MALRIFEVAIPFELQKKADLEKIRVRDFFSITVRIFKTFFFAKLGDMAIEEAQSILNNVVEYNQLIYEEYSRFVGQRVLEVGTASGNNARLLLDRNFLVLTDIHQSYIESLQYQYRDWENIHVRKFDASEISSFKEKDWEGTFDTIICLNVVEHIQDDAQVLKNFYRLLKQGGHCIILVPAHQKIYGAMDKCAGHYKRYCEKDLRTLFENAGFKLKQVAFFNPLAVAGWWFNGVILKRKTIPPFQTKIFNKISFLIRWLKPLKLPFGISIIGIGEKQ